MAETLANMRFRIHQRIGDEVATPQVVSDGTITALLNDALMDASNLNIAGGRWQNTVVTLVSGTDTYQPSTSTQYSSFDRMRRNLDGYLMEKVSVAEVQRRKYMGTNTTNTIRALPTAWAAYDDGTGNIKVIVDPTPGDNEAGKTLDAFISDIPTLLVQDTDAVTLNRAVISWLEAEVAWKAVTGLSADALDRIGKGPGHVQVLGSIAQTLKAQVLERTSELQAQSDFILGEH